MESSGLTALDACYICKGGDYTCNNNDNNLVLSFYGRCNCSSGLDLAFFSLAGY